MSELDSYASLPGISSLLDAIASPAILMDRDYRIRAANQAYRDAFVGNDALLSRHCYEVSHGYKVPCDQAGEHCPLRACLNSGQRQRVLHIHNTRYGKEHVDVELSPVHNPDGDIEFFVEVMHPLNEARGPEHQGMIGFSPAFNQMLELLNRAAPADISVLLLGESGTGKELAAQYLHSHSHRANRPFVTVECSGLTESLFESELFGHEKGAFTGASQRKMGLVQAAEGGTLFLDEVGDIPLPMQVKLLRLIETGTYRPVGSVHEKHANFRLICATHRRLQDMVARQQFRQDLYYRIAPFPVLLPSLHERQEDIAPIAERLLQRITAERSLTLSDDAREWLGQQHFAGNIRELRNRLERAVLLCDGDEIEPGHLQLPESLQHPSVTSAVSSAAIPVSPDGQLPSYRSPDCPKPQDQQPQGHHQPLHHHDDLLLYQPPRNQADEVPMFNSAPLLPLDQLEGRYLLAMADRFKGDNAALAKALAISERTLYRKLARARELCDPSATGDERTRHNND